MFDITLFNIIEFSINGNAFCRLITRTQKYCSGKILLQSALNLGNYAIPAMHVTPELVPHYSRSEVYI